MTNAHDEIVQGSLAKDSLDWYYKLTQIAMFILALLTFLAYMVDRRRPLRVRIELLAKNQVVLTEKSKKDLKNEIENELREEISEDLEEYIRALAVKEVGKAVSNASRTDARASVG